MMRQSWLPFQGSCQPLGWLRGRLLTPQNSCFSRHDHITINQTNPQDLHRHSPFPIPHSQFSISPASTQKGPPGSAGLFLPCAAQRRKGKRRGGRTALPPVSRGRGGNREHRVPIDIRGMKIGTHRLWPYVPSNVNTLPGTAAPAPGCPEDVSFLRPKKLILGPRAGLLARAHRLRAFSAIANGFVRFAHPHSSGPVGDSHPVPF